MKKLRVIAYEGTLVCEKGMGELENGSTSGEKLALKEATVCE